MVVGNYEPFAGDDFPGAAAPELDNRVLQGGIVDVVNLFRGQFAARGGNLAAGTLYAGSDNVDDVAWFYFNSDNSTHAVATKAANELGLFDMSGNVCEWCSDWYGTYQEMSQTDPAGPEEGTRRVFRGGSWYSISRDCRNSSRNGDDPANRSNNLGLRLAL